MVAEVTVTGRTVSSLTLFWERQVNKKWTYILDINGESSSVSRGYSSDNFTVNYLEPGTKYLFSVTTVFSGLRSTPYEGTGVTSMSQIVFAWLFLLKMTFRKKFTIALQSLMHIH